MKRFFRPQAAQGAEQQFMQPEESAPEGTISKGEILSASFYFKASS